MISNKTLGGAVCGAALAFAVASFRSREEPLATCSSLADATIRRGITTLTDPALMFQLESAPLQGVHEEAFQKLCNTVEDSLARRGVPIENVTILVQPVEGRLPALQVLFTGEDTAHLSHEVLRKRAKNSL